MSMSPDEFNEVSKLMAIVASEMDAYLDRVKSAYKFAGPEEGADESWNGLFLMGLAMAGLELVPYSSSIQTRMYWVKSPKPKGGTEEWEVSWIVPIDAFDKVSES